MAFIRLKEHKYRNERSGEQQKFVQLQSDATVLAAFLTIDRRTDFRSRWCNLRRLIQSLVPDQHHLP